MKPASSRENIQTTASYEPSNDGVEAAHQNTSAHQNASFLPPIVWWNESLYSLCCLMSAFLILCRLMIFLYNICDFQFCIPVSLKSIGQRNNLKWTCNPIDLRSQSFVCLKSCCLAYLKQLSFPPSFPIPLSLSLLLLPSRIFSGIFYSLPLLSLCVAVLPILFISEFPWSS